MQPHSTFTPYFPENLDDYAPWVARHGLAAPYGECQCGCGQKVNILKQNGKTHGWRNGHPGQFVHKHSRRNKGIAIPDRYANLPDSMRVIPLTKGQFALVDAAEYDWLSQWSWRAYKRDKVWYASRSIRLSDGRATTVSMHREILGVAPGVEVDHKDGDGLNNARDNLRPATPHQNTCNRGMDRDNSIGYKGVRRQGAKWRAVIGCLRKSYHLGTYDTPEDAARAYDAAARDLHGEFARTNFSPPVMLGAKAQEPVQNE